MGAIKMFRISRWMILLVATSAVGGGSNALESRTAAGEKTLLLVDDHHILYHAGTRLRDDGIVTAGGRVLCVTALGEPLQEACDKAYAAVDRIAFEGAYHRRDIAHRALARAT